MPVTADRRIDAEHSGRSARSRHQAARPWSEWQTEQMISLETATRLMPHGPALRTAYVYAKDGVKSRITGLTVKLESFSVPGRQLMTSREAVERFLDRLNGIGVELEEMAQ